jgi:hypothetical protein
VQRWLSAYGVGVDGIQVEVGDTGEGFLLTSVPQERLGVRVSIMERVAGAGGEAQIDSAPGEGTIVTIRWPAHPTGILAGGDTGSVDVDGRRDVTAADPGIAPETRGVTS